MANTNYISRHTGEQIDDAVDKVSNLINDVSELTTQVEENKTEYNEFKNSIEEDVNNINTNIDNIEDDVEQLKDRPVYTPTTHHIICKIPTVIPIEGDARNLVVHIIYKSSSSTLYTKETFFETYHFETNKDKMIFLTTFNVIKPVALGTITTCEVPRISGISPRESLEYIDVCVGASSLDSIQALLYEDEVEFYDEII